MQLRPRKSAGRGGAAARLRCLLQDQGTSDDSKNGSCCRDTVGTARQSARKTSLLKSEQRASSRKRHHSTDDVVGRSQRRHSLPAMPTGRDAAESSKLIQAHNTATPPSLGRRRNTREQLRRKRGGSSAFCDARHRAARLGGPNKRATTMDTLNSQGEGVEDGNRTSPGERARAEHLSHEAGKTGTIGNVTTVCERRDTRRAETRVRANRSVRRGSQAPRAGPARRPDSQARFTSVWGSPRVAEVLWRRASTGGEAARPTLWRPPAVPTFGPAATGLQSPSLVSAGAARCQRPSSLIRPGIGLDHSRALVR